MRGTKSLHWSPSFNPTHPFFLEPKAEDFLFFPLCLPCFTPSTVQGRQFLKVKAEANPKYRCGMDKKIKGILPNWTGSIRSIRKSRPGIDPQDEVRGNPLFSSFRLWQGLNGTFLYCTNLLDPIEPAQCGGEDQEALGLVVPRAEPQP